MREYVLVYNKALEVGLRSIKHLPANSQSLTLSTGAFPEDGMIKAVDDLEAKRIAITGLNFTFPYPQLFELSQITLLCGPTAIYEVVNGTPVLRLSGLPEGIPWSVADFGRLVILVNGKWIVTRDGESLEFRVDNPLGLPIGTSICNFNGQAIFTAPTAEIPALDI